MQAHSELAADPGSQHQLHDRTSAVPAFFACASPSANRVVRTPNGRNDRSFQRSRYPSIASPPRTEFSGSDLQQADSGVVVSVSGRSHSTDRRHHRRPGRRSRPVLRLARRAVDEHLIGLSHPWAGRYCEDRRKTVIVRSAAELLHRSRMKDQSGYYERSIAYSTLRCRTCATDATRSLLWRCGSGLRRTGDGLGISLCACRTSSRCRCLWRSTALPSFLLCIIFIFYFLFLMIYDLHHRPIGHLKPTFLGIVVQRRSFLVVFLIILCGDLRVLAIRVSELYRIHQLPCTIDV